MARKIDWEKPLSDEDYDWLVTNGREDEAAASDQKHNTARAPRSGMTREQRAERIVALQAELDRLNAEQAAAENPNVANPATGLVDNTPVDGEAPEGAPSPAGDNYEDKTNEELRDLLRERELSTKGTKAEMVERLREDDQRDEDDEEDEEDDE